MDGERFASFVMLGERATRRALAGFLAGTLASLPSLPAKGKRRDKRGRLRRRVQAQSSANVDVRCEPHTVTPIAWAIYSTPEDLAEIEQLLTPAGMDPPDRAEVDRYLRAGFACWRDAPCIPPEHPCCPTDCVESTPGGTCMRVVVINYGSKADFFATFRMVMSKYHNQPDPIFYEEFYAKPQYSVDPYPPPAGYFDGMSCT